jgi:cytochrome c2
MAPDFSTCNDLALHNTAMSSRIWTPGRIVGVLCVLAIPAIGISLLDEVPTGHSAGGNTVEQGPPYEAVPLPTGAPQDGLTFEVAGQQDVRGFSQLALYVPEGRPPTDFLPTGSFKATFQGRLRVPARDRYTFHFIGTGDFEMSLGDKLVLKVVDGQVTTETRFRLKKGSQVVTAKYASPKAGPAVLRVYWQSRDFAREPIPSRALAHDTSAVAGRFANLRRGRELVQEYRCAGCHADSVAGRGAPALFGVGTRLRTEWMAKWIENPRQLRPMARMPKLLHGSLAPQAARDIAAYLATLGEPSKPVSLTEQQRKDGGEFFVDYGCLACHTLPSSTDPVAAAGRIPLSHVGAKWQPAALAEFLAKPARHFPDIRMPDYGFTDEEAQSVAAFLLSVEGASLPSDGGGGDPVAGERLARRHGCASCHGLAATSEVKAPRRPVTRAGSVACTFADYGLSEQDLRCVQEYLTTSRTGVFTAVEYAERTLRSYRCVACHDHGSQEALFAKVRDEAADLVSSDPNAIEHGGAAPSLTHTGGKLQTDWLIAWLRDGVEPRPRPWLAMPMPRFRLDAERFAQGLAFAHGYAPSGGPATVHNGMLVDARNAPTLNHGQDDSADAESLRAIGGKLLPQDGGFGCMSCHALGDAPAQSVFEAPGIDLALTTKRLRKEYYHRWLLDPTRIDPTTKMTRFIDSDGLSGLTDILGGRGWQQVEAIWHHLDTLR